MPRRKKNAQKRYKPKAIRTRSRPVILALHKCKDDDISPGIIRAAAEWRNEY